MNVVVTGGGMVAPIDDVRSITNTSTGRFSAAITEACLDVGATVHHIHAPGADLPLTRLAQFSLEAQGQALRDESSRIEVLRTRYEGAKDRLHLLPLRPPTVHHYAKVLENLLATRPIDLIFLAMAVSDYEPEPIAGKLGSASETLVVRCRKTPKVIRSVRDWAPSAILVGFKLLSNVPESVLIRAAEEACVKNRADLTVANDLRLIREGRHTVHLVRPGHPSETFGPAPELATELVTRVFELARTIPRKGS